MTQLDPTVAINWLPPRQRRVFEYLGEGLSNKDIAVRLDVSESTVKSHVSAIFVKLGCKRRIAAALLSLQFSNRGMPTRQFHDGSGVDNERPVCTKAGIAC